MTDSGNANSPRTRDLTELAPAPSQSEGNCPCSHTCYRHQYVGTLHMAPLTIEWSRHNLALLGSRSRMEVECSFADCSEETRLDVCRFCCPARTTDTPHYMYRSELMEQMSHAQRRLVEAEQWIAKHDALVDRINAAREAAAARKQAQANAKSKLGPWEFTLTYSPKQHGWTRDEAQDKMREAITRLTSYYREEIEEFHATGEFNQAGDPHVHCWYRMDGGRKITTKSFIRAYPIWNPKVRTGPRGHVGGHHEPVKRTSDFAGYIQKDLDTAWLMVNITNGPREETSGSEAAGGSAAPSGPSSPRASPESHDG